MGRVPRVLSLNVNGTIWIHGNRALCKKWIGPYLPVRVSIESAYKG